jgi:hypothetical protein
MADEKKSTEVKVQQRRWDVPHLIKWILLIFLLVLLAAEMGAGEFKRLGDGFGNWAWFILLLKIILIIGLIWLMKIQRHLKCEITDPNGCTEEVPDTVNGILTVTVRGTASGTVFGSYTLELQKDGDPPITGIVSYPGSGASGTAQVVNGVLGTFDTTLLSDGAYTITLRVFPSGSGSPCIKTKTFNLLKVAVFINSVGGSEPTTHILDENAELGVAPSVDSLGGPLSIFGSAYIYECAGRKVKNVEMRHAKIAAPGPGPAQPPTNAPIPGDWPVTNQLHAPLVYSDLPPPTKYNMATRIGVAPTSLLNDWGTCTIFGTVYSRLKKRNWNSRTATDDATGMGGAKLNLLLIVEDTIGQRYFDTQRVWIDNWPVVCKLVKFQRQVGGSWTDIPPCTDILMSWGDLRVRGLAWDALIDSAWPAATNPNDNFDDYSLSYSKQFVPGSVSIPVATPGVRVPNTLAPVPGPLPTDADADTLAVLDLTTLDAGASPQPGKCPNPAGHPHHLHRGCECTYIITLHASDTTKTQSTAEHNKHNRTHKEAIKIVNDL